MKNSPSAEDNIHSGKRKRSPGNLVDVPIPIPLPRRPVSASESWSIPVSQDAHPLPKRPRLPTPMERQMPKTSLEDLPDALLQHIFSYVDPVALARLIGTSKRLNLLLDSRLKLARSNDELANNVYTLRSQDSIWHISRRRYLPTMPKPMKGLSDRAQLALTFNSTCQYCGKGSVPANPGTSNPWKAGPGKLASRAVWPFRIRGCSACILQRVRKVNLIESDVLS